MTLTYLEDQTGSDGTFSGTRIYGLSKCASAQWDFFGELEGDYAAVSYACAIGDDQTSSKYNVSPDALSHGRGSGRSR